MSVNDWTKTDHLWQFVKNMDLTNDDGNSVKSLFIFKIILADIFQIVVRNILLLQDTFIKHQIKQKVQQVQYRLTKMK